MRSSRDDISVFQDKDVFAAICLLQLAEEGILDLHAPVTGYLPWFSVRSNHAPIAIHHLMTHTAGIIGGTEHEILRAAG